MTSRRVLLGIAFLSFIAIGMVPGIINVAWKHMEVTFGVSLDSLGLVLLAATVSRMFATVFNGVMIDRFGLARTLAGGTLVGVIGAFGYAVAPSFPMLLVGAFITAIGTGIIDAGMNTYLSAHHGKGPLNWLHAFYGVGLATGPLIVTVIVVDLGESWRLSYGVLAGALGVVLVALMLTLSHWRLPQAAQDDSDDLTSPKKSATPLETLTHPAVILLMLVFALYGGLEVSVGQLSDSLLTKSRDVSQEVAGLWISVYWSALTIGRMLSGTFGGRVSNVTLMRGSIIGAIAGTMLLWSSLPEVIGLAVIGLSIAPMFATIMSDTPERVGRRHAANAIGFQIGFAGIGAATLTGIAGVLADNISLEIVPPYLVVNAVMLGVVYELIRRRDRIRATQQATPPTHSPEITFSP